MIDYCLFLIKINHHLLKNAITRIINQDNRLSQGLGL